MKAIASGTILVALSYSLGALASDVNLRGIPPSRHHLYQSLSSSKGEWKCLNSSETIPFTSINDDYCDCADGSDEPGTSACSGLDTPIPEANWFWCENKGHIPSYIRNSRVNDGICDPECCDGSDEYGPNNVVQCPDVCGKVGKEYRKKKQEEENIKSAGSKIRASYISETIKKMSDLQAQVTSLEVEIEVARETEKARKEELDRAEQMDQAVIEEKKKSPLYATLRQHQEALGALSDKNVALKEELARLTDLLDDLSDGYNPNYQDMAVKGAVMAYRSWRKGSQEDEPSGTEEAQPVEAESDETSKAPSIKAQANAKLDSLKDEGDWPKNTVDGLVNQETLELLDDSYFTGRVLDTEQQENILFRVYEYLPETFVPVVDRVVDSLLDILIKTNVITGVKRRSSSSATGKDAGEPENVTKARKAYNDASAHTRSISSQLSTKRSSLNTNPEKYGRDAEWKALEGQCISKNMGEYTYEYCFFGSTTQKPNKGGSNVSMGRFGAFEPLDTSLTINDDDYFHRQKYVNGQRCWNGPDRSTIVDVECGTENALLDVFEAEKCIYSMKVTTPAVCFPKKVVKEEMEQGDGTVRDEL
ncbi:unnamed protein product [Sympodiomycopsis kandeliae]